MSTAEGVLPTADCSVIDKTKPKNEPTKTPVKLCMFMEPLTAVETLERTLQYAKDSKQYLIDILGEEEFEAKKDLLCIPSEVNIDFYGTGTTRQHFEAHIAKLLGKNHGRFFITGVQAQLAALKSHAERGRRNKVAWHVTSHLENNEADAYSQLYGLEKTLLGSRADSLPTPDEIRKAADVPEAERPAAILIEIPNRVLGCQTYSFAELQEISRICKAASVGLHCDGARLWEIEPYYKATAGVSFKEICACFDSVYVSFYKGLRGLTGAMLVHNDPIFMDEAKTWQRRAGGNVFTLGMEVLDCQRGFNEMSGTFDRKRAKMIRVVQDITATTKDFKTDSGEPVVGFMPAEATCAQIVTVFRGHTEADFVMARDRVEARTGVRVFERFRPMQNLQAKVDGKVPEVKAEECKVHCVEWMMMSITEKIEDQVFIDAYRNLCEELDHPDATI